MCQVKRRDNDTHRFPYLGMGHRGQIPSDRLHASIIYLGGAVRVGVAQVHQTYAVAGRN